MRNSILLPFFFSSLVLACSSTAPGAPTPGEGAGACPGEQRGCADGCGHVSPAQCTDGKWVCVTPAIACPDAAPDAPLDAPIDVGCRGEPPPCTDHCGHEYFPKCVSEQWVC